MSCGSCGASKPKEEEKVQYKCKACGAVSEEPEDCCGEPMEKLCDCGSGEMAADCCEKE